MKMGHLLARKDTTTGKTVIQILRFAISAGLIGLLFHIVDIEKIWAQITGVHVPLFALACCLFLIGQVLSVVRWRWVICKHQDPPGVWYLNGVLHIGLFFNLFLPSTVGGDVIRAELSKTGTARRSDAYAAVMYDQLIAFLSVAAIGVAALGFGYVTIGWFEPAIAVAAFAFAAVGAVAWVALSSDHCKILLRMFARGPLEKILTHVDRLLALLRCCVKDNGLFLRTFTISVLVQVIGVNLVVACLAMSLSIDVPIWFHFIAVPIITIVTLVPISINGFGVREVSFILIYENVGVAADAAIALSFAWTAVLILFSLFGGLFFQFPALYRGLDPSHSGPPEKV